MRPISLRFWVFVVASSILQALPFAIAGPVPEWRRAFCWIALAPLFFAVLSRDAHGDSLRPKQAAAVGYLCGILWYLANCYWIYQTMYLYGGLPKPVALGVLLLFGLYLGLYHALFAWLLSVARRRLSGTVSFLLVPFLWVAVELARDRITGFPWDLLGYTQIDNAVLTLLAPVGGVMAISFVIACVNAAFAAAWMASGRRRIVLAASAVGATCLCLAGLIYRPPADPATHAATLLQENIVPGAAGREVEELSPEEKYHQFSALSQHPLSLDSSSGQWVAASDAATDLIVWPEAPAEFFSHDPYFRTQLGTLAASMHAPVISGSVGVDFDPASEGGRHIYGSAAVFSSDGKYFGRYDKIHLVPWGEYVPYKSLFFFAGKLTAGSGNFEPGTRRTVFSLNGHKAGIFICYESIFGDEVREFPLGGADVLVNISDDGWYGDTGAPWQHLDMERMRAIENSRWILRDTNTGITTSIDPHGRGVFSTPRHVRTAFRVPFDYVTGTTFYTRHGDWFAWLCVLASVALLAVGRTRRTEVH